MTILNTIAQALDVAPLSMKAVLSSYTLSLAVFITVSGWMADRFGTRWVLDSTHARLLGGVAALSDELQAKTQLGSAQSQLADSIAQRALLERAIAVMLEVPPSMFSIDRTATLPSSVWAPSTLPSQLLERRPDIATAKQRVAVAYAQIGVADAAFFPALSLSSTVGYNQLSFANLVSAPNLAWSLAQSISVAIKLKYLQGSEVFADIRLPDPPGIMNGTLAGCFAFVGAAEAANGWCNRGSRPSRRSYKSQSAFLNKEDVAFTGSGFLDVVCPISSEPVEPSFFHVNPES